MSKVIINKKYLQSKSKKDLVIGLLLIMVGIGVEVVLSEFGKDPNLYLLIPLIVLVIPGIYCIQLFAAANRRMKKDDLTQRDLSMLPEKYTVLRNVYLPYRGEIMECHFVVIGENGVFVIEACGNKGNFYESKDNNYWLMYKNKNKNKLFVKPLENQKKVVDVKVLALAEYLKKYNIHIWIQGINYFPDKKANVYLFNHKTVFNDVKELNNFIINFPSKVEIDELKKEKIEKLLNLDTLKRKISSH